MNILLTSTGFLEDHDHKYLIKTWRDHHHAVEAMPFDRVMGYLKVDQGNRWAVVDAIVCKADTDPEGGTTYTLPRALKLAGRLSSSPGILCDEGWAEMEVDSISSLSRTSRTISAVRRR